MNRRQALPALLGGAAAGLALLRTPLALAAASERLVVGYAPGGGVDALARAVTPEFARELSRSVVIDNRPGAGGTVAADSVANAAADGSTLLFADTTLLISPHVLRSVRYDPQKSFAPIGRIARIPLVLAVHSSVAARTPQEFIALLKASPGRFSYGSAGIATMHHLGGELLKQTAGLDMVHVSYKGGAPAVQDLVGGQIPVAIASLSAVLPHVQAGRVRLIAVLTESRLALLPDVPALSEAVPGFDATPTAFMLAPAGTPAAVLNEHAGALTRALAARATTDAFATQAAVASPLEGRALSEWMQREETRWRAVIERSAIKID